MTNTELSLGALRRDFEEDFTPSTIGGVEWMRRGRNGGYLNPSTQSAWQGYSACAARRATIQPTAEPVGEIVMHANYSTVVRWLPVMPPSGTKLYAEAVAPADDVKEQEREP